MCHGRGVNNVKAQFMNPACDLCGGRGTVDTEKICKCGRPAIRIVGNEEICTHIMCFNRVQPSKEANDSLVRIGPMAHMGA